MDWTTEAIQCGGLPEIEGPYDIASPQQYSTNAVDDWVIVATTQRCVWVGNDGSLWRVIISEREVLAKDI